MRQIRHFVHRNLLVLAFELPPLDVRFQPSAEVVRAHACIDDGEDDEDHRDDGEGGQRAPYGYVIRYLSAVVHPDELEEEVGEAGEIENLRTAIVSSVSEVYETAWGLHSQSRQPCLICFLGVSSMRPAVE